jgi:membrane protein DedA with SNARE-associated domain
MIGINGHLGATVLIHDLPICTRQLVLGAEGVMRMLSSGPQPHLPGFLNALAGPLDHFGYWAVLLFVMIEDFGVPVPGETILIAAAAYAGAGRLNVVMVGVIGFAAAVIGDNIGFALGHYGGRALILRWGRYVRLTGERLAQAEAFFNQHGAWIITIARFVEVLRQANGIVAGTTGMRWRRFLAFNALGAALWVGTWVSLGYLAGKHIDAIYHDITRYSSYLLIALAVVLAASLARHILRRRRRRTGPASRQTKASQAQDESKTTAGNGR